MKHKEMINNPAWYGGAKNPYEVIKVIEAWELDFHLGTALKYIPRAGKKDPSKTIEDLKKSIWYINRKIEMVQKGKFEYRRTNLSIELNSTKHFYNIWKVIEGFNINDLYLDGSIQCLYFISESNYKENMMNNFKQAIYNINFHIKHIIGKGE